MADFLRAALDGQLVNNPNNPGPASAESFERFAAACRVPALLGYPLRLSARHGPAWLLRALAASPISALETTGGPLRDAPGPDGLSALMLACQAERADCVRALAASGCRLDAAPAREPYRTALYECASRGKVGMATLLLELRADPDPSLLGPRPPPALPAWLAECVDSDSDSDSPNEASAGPLPSPLFAAVAQGHVAVVALLLKHRASLHSANSGGLLAAAAGGGQIEALRLLLRAGADVSQCNPAQLRTRSRNKETDMCARELEKWVDRRAAHAMVEALSDARVALVCAQLPRSLTASRSQTRASSTHAHRCAATSWASTCGGASQWALWCCRPSDPAITSVRS